MINEKALELLKDKDFLLELGKAANVEEAQEKFQSKGADLTIDELLALRTQARQAISEELTDDELKLVAGGLTTLDGKANYTYDKTKSHGEYVPLKDIKSDSGNTNGASGDKSFWNGLNHSFLEVDYFFEELFKGW